MAVAVALGSHFSVDSGGWIFTTSWFGDLPSRRLELLTIYSTWMADDAEPAFEDARTGNQAGTERELGKD